MALPNELKSDRILGTEFGTVTPGRIADLEQAIADILGIPIDTPIDTPIDYSITDCSERTLAAVGSTTQIAALTIPAGTVRPNDVLYFEFGGYIQAQDQEQTDVWLRLLGIDYFNINVAGLFGSPAESYWMYKGEIWVRSSSVAIIKAWIEDAWNGSGPNLSQGVFLPLAFDATAQFEIFVRGLRTDASGIARVDFSTFNTSRSNN